MGICSSLGIDWPHLCPINDWVEDEPGPNFRNGDSRYLIDKTTEDRYFNSWKRETRITFIAVAFATIPHAMALVAATVYRIFHVLSFYAFWRRDSTSRFTEWATDVTRILISPLAIPCLFLSAIYGVLKPNDGRKLHSRMEILFHGHPLIALCMHPQVCEHSLPTKDAYDNKLRRFQAMIVATLLEQPIRLIISAVYRIIRFLSFYSLWQDYYYGTYYNGTFYYGTSKDRFFNWIKDGLDILAAPFGIPLCLIATVYALIQPEKGFELFQEVQKLCYRETLSEEVSVIIPPDLGPHWGGGDADLRGAL